MKYALSSNFLCLSWPKFMKLGQGRFPIWSRPALLIDLFFWRWLNIVTTILLFKPDLLLIQLRPAREKRGFLISLEDEFTNRRKTWSWTGAWKVKKTDMYFRVLFLCFCVCVCGKKGASMAHWEDKVGGVEVLLLSSHPAPLPSSSISPLLLCLLLLASHSWTICSCCYILFLRVGVKISTLP